MVISQNLGMLSSVAHCCVVFACFTFQENTKDFSNIWFCPETTRRLKICVRPRILLPRGVPSTVRKFVRRTRVGGNNRVARARGTTED